MARPMNAIGKLAVSVACILAVVAGVAGILVRKVEQDSDLPPLKIRRRPKDTPGDSSRIGAWKSAVARCFDEILATEPQKKLLREGAISPKHFHFSQFDL